MARELGVGGSERQLAATARALDRERFRPHVACFRSGMRSSELQDAGVPVIELPVRSLHKPSAVAGARLLRRYLKDHRIQLVHTFDTPANLFGVPVACLAGIPVVLSSQRAHRDLSPPMTRRLLSIAHRMADAVVVNCESLARHMTEDQGLDCARVMLCYNGLDTSAFYPLPPGQERARKLPGHDLVVGVVCSLREEKRLDLLVEAFAKIAAPGRRLVMVGSGIEQPALEAQISRLGIGSYCHLEPATSDVAGWLRSIDIFVLPSRTEGLSNSLMEAMACGLAVIASDAGGNPELVREGCTGLLFPSGDASALASALGRLAGDVALREELGARAAAFIRDRFSLQAAAQRMGEIYLEKLGASENS
jgi:L-malate glycosyltransferase